MPLLLQRVDHDLCLVLADGERKSRCARIQPANGMIHNQARARYTHRCSAAGDGPFFDAAHDILPIHPEMELVVEHHFINLRFQIDLQMQRALELLHVGGDALNAGFRIRDHDAADHPIDREFASGREQ